MGVAGLLCYGSYPQASGCSICYTLYSKGRENKQIKNMEMKDNLKKYGVGFVERLGGFVKEENKIAKELKLTQDERKAIQTTTFEILGRDAKGWVKRAGIKQNGDSWEYKAI